MAAIDLLVSTVHVVFAGAWTGAVVFAALTGLDPGDGARLKWLSRASALVLLVTGGHLAAQGYGDGALTGTTAGWAVLAMVALWFALTALVEVAVARNDRGTRSDPLLRVAGVVALLLLVDAGLLAGGL